MSFPNNRHGNTPPYLLSAYGIAVKHGYTGTEEEWLASLKGDQGEYPRMQFDSETGYLQIRYDDSGEWTDIASLADLMTESEEAVVASAKEYADTAEAYAKGTVDGEAVEEDDPGYEDNAKYYAGQASTYASAAGGFATGASNYAQAASGYATTASGHADNAAASATAAAGSASDAAGSAASASNSAGAASTSASAAEAQATQAGTYAYNADQSAQQAASYAAAANTAYSAVVDVANGVDVKVEDIETQVSIAAGYATNAGTSATAAAGSATAAAGSATAAAGSASNAADSATAAAGSATAAAGSASSVSESAAQITTNKNDIADLKSAIITDRILTPISVEDNYVIRADPGQYFGDREYNTNCKNATIVCAGYKVINVDIPKTAYAVAGLVFYGADNTPLVGYRYAQQQFPSEELTHAVFPFDVPTNAAYAKITIYKSVEEYFTVTTPIPETDLNAQNINALRNALSSVVTQTGWVKGTYGTSSGGNLTDNRYIRNGQFVGITDGIMQIITDNGYMFVVFAWDMSGTYVGVLHADGTFMPTSNPAFVAQFECGHYPNYKFKIALARDTATTDITSDEGVHVKFLNMSIDGFKIPFPIYPKSKYGTNGQFLSTDGAGNTEWKTIEPVSEQAVENAVNEWMDDNPDVRALVNDGSITAAKFAPILEGELKSLSSFSGASDEERLYDALITQSYIGSIFGGNITIDSSISIPQKGLRDVRICNAYITLNADMFTTTAANTGIPSFVNCRFNGNGHSIFSGSYAVGGYFIGCSFKNCSIVNSNTTTLQSLYAIGCTVYNTTVPLIKALRIYDHHIIGMCGESQNASIVDTYDSTFETGGTQQLWVSNSLFEGFTVPVFKLSGGRISIKDTYFEANQPSIVIAKNANAQNGLLLEICGCKIQDNDTAIQISGFTNSYNVRMSIHHNTFASGNSTPMITGFVYSDLYSFYANTKSENQEVIISNIDQLPAIPSTNGSYYPKVTVNSSGITQSWESVT